MEQGKISVDVNCSGALCVDMHGWSSAFVAPVESDVVSVVEETEVIFSWSDDCSAAERGHPPASRLRLWVRLCCTGVTEHVPEVEIGGLRIKIGGVKVVAGAVFVIEGDNPRSRGGSVEKR